MRAKIFFAAVAQPDAQFLRDLILLSVCQRPIQSQRFVPLRAAGGIVVILPPAARQSNPAADFLDKRRARQRLIVVGRHAPCIRMFGFKAIPHSVDPGASSDASSRSRGGVIGIINSIKIAVAAGGGSDYGSRAG